MYQIQTDNGIIYKKDMPEVVERLEMIKGESQSVVVSKIGQDGEIIERSDLSKEYGVNYHE